MTICSSQKAIRVPRKRISQLVAFLAQRERANFAEVDIAVVTSREIAALNRRYLNHAGATDVLSFDLSEPGAEAITAQLVVCGQRAVSQARRYGHGPQRELLLYVVHGLLHLLGYDDTTHSAASHMGREQDKLLDDFFRCRRARHRQ